MPLGGVKVPESDPVWELSLGGEAVVCVAPTLDQVTPYVLLEREDWFEDEIGFVRRLAVPGMTMLDIGANHGVYSLAVAARIGEGWIWAFEPTAAPRGRFERSLARNRFAASVTVIAAALSDAEGEGEMAVSASSEFNSLHGKTGNLETVRIRTLDSCADEHFPGVGMDFVKIDAEGEELAILRGGERFFARQSPLVMFEVVHAETQNVALPSAFLTLGYDLFVLIPEAGVLVPTDGNATGTLNLFACKPDRAAALRERGLLATEEDLSEPVRVAVRPQIALARLESLPFAEPRIAEWSRYLVEELPPAYLGALAAALEACDTRVAPVARVRLWRSGLLTLESLPDDLRERPEVVALRLHLLHALGLRMAALREALKLESALRETKARVEWPVLPPLPESHDRVSWRETGAWLAARASEYVVLRGVGSSLFGNREWQARLGAQIADPDRSVRIDRMIAIRIAARLGEFHEAFCHPRHRAAWDEVLPTGA